MQTVSLRIWTCVAVSVSYDDIYPIHYSTSNHFLCNAYYQSVGVIGMMFRVFANGLGDLGSIPDRVIPKTQKMVLDASLLNSQHYKVQIKGKVEQSRERSSTLPYALV